MGKSTVPKERLRTLENEIRNGFQARHRAVTKLKEVRDDEL
jgi:hypothetical protein